MNAPIPRQTPDCLLTLAAPSVLEEELLDALLAHPEIAPGFTVVHGQGIGTHVELSSAMERVQGRAGRVMVQVALAQSHLPALIAMLRTTLPSPQIAYWVVPLVGFWTFGRIFVSRIAMVSLGVWAQRPLAVLCMALACTGAVAADAGSSQDRPEETVALLPPAQTVVQVLSLLPQVRAAQAQVAAAQARSVRLQVGPYDWVAKAAANRHRDEVGGRFTETEIGLETTLRWPGKVKADQQLGALEVSAGTLVHADAWHEAARGLLGDWFDALRAARTAAVLHDQALLAAQQLSVTQRRVQAGEAPPLELLAAQAEEARIFASAVQAKARAEVGLRALRRQYPSLPEPDAHTTALEAVAMAWPTAKEGEAHHASTTDVSQWAAQILDDNHELELAETRARQAQLQAQRSQMERRADPTLGVRATRESSRQSQQLGVYVSLPLGGAGRRADAQAAIAQAEVAEQTLAQVRQRVETEAWRTAYAVVEARATWLPLERARERTQRSAALQARAYELGESPLADLLLARRNALDATLAAETAVLDSLQSQARLLLDSHKLWRPVGIAEH